MTHALLLSWHRSAEPPRASFQIPGASIGYGASLVDRRAPAPVAELRILRADPLQVRDSLCTGLDERSGGKDLVVEVYSVSAFFGFWSDDFAAQRAQFHSHVPAHERLAPFDGHIYFGLCTRADAASDMATPSALHHAHAAHVARAFDRLAAGLSVQRVAAFGANVAPPFDGLFAYQAEDDIEADMLIGDDPYVRGGVFSDCRIYRALNGTGSYGRLRADQ